MAVIRCFVLHAPGILHHFVDDFGNWRRYPVTEDP